MSDLRAEFEKVLAEQQRLELISHHFCEAWSDENKCYLDNDYDNLYRMFLASRAAPKVELPELYECSWGHGFYCEDDIKQVLDKAGIRYE